MKDRPPEQRVFLNRRSEPLTRFGIHTLVKTCVAQAAKGTRSVRTLPSQRVILLKGSQQFPVFANSTCVLCP